MSYIEAVKAAPYDMKNLDLPPALDPHRDPVHALLMSLIKQVALLQVQVDAMGSCFEGDTEEPSGVPSYSEFQDAFVQVLYKGHDEMHDHDPRTALERQAQILLDGAEELHQEKPFD